MQKTPKQSHIAFRCPSCGEPVTGLVGKFALSADMLRLRCPCGESSLDIHARREGKLELSVPCVFCKKQHTYSVAQSLVFEHERFDVSCPYANMDIAFMGDPERVSEDIERTARQLRELLRDLETDKLSDIQPQDMDPDEVLPDPEVYDTLRFVVRELEADGAIDCPCHSGAYDLRFVDDGIQVFCLDCGASRTFPADSVHAAREYVNIDSIILK